MSTNTKFGAWMKDIATQSARNITCTSDITKYMDWMKIWRYL